MNLGTSIKKIREKKGLTQEQLAELVGITSNYLGIIERGIKTPKLATFINIANALQVSADCLLANELNICRQVQATYLETAIAELSEQEQQRVFDLLEILTKKY